MKTIGILGGMSWESTALYYELLNKSINNRNGGYSACKCIINSVNFGDIEPLARADDWKTIDGILAKEAMKIEKAGADFLVVAANTAHLCYEAITNAISIPMLHIAEPTGRAIKDQKLQKVALLGTRYTMEKDFYRAYIYKNFGVEVIVPEHEEILHVNNIIFSELIKGKIEDFSKEIMIEIISNLEKRGAQGVILGCTEIPILISQKDVNIPVFDTTLLHVKMAVEMALSDY